MRTCVIEGCGNSVLARGWCKKHYLRWYKTGDPEKTIEQVRVSGENHGNYKHGLWGHPLYKTWNNMLDRCQNEKSKAYQNYGARGITVCSRWRKLENFIEDMGERPDGFSLERLDNDKGYYKDNCAWVDSTAQSRNRRCVKLTFELAEAIRSEPRKGKNGRGDGMTREQIGRKYGVSVATIKKVLSGEYWRAGEKIAETLKRS